MLIIHINGHPRQAFINHACRFALQPVSIAIHGTALRIRGMSAESAAEALAYAAFPAWEKTRLQTLIRKNYYLLDAAKQERLAVLAQIVAGDQMPDALIYQGIGRESRLARAFAAALMQGPLNFEGFCRFRLPGYEDYLRGIMLLAEEELIAEEENLEYLELLRRSLSQGNSQISLFFSPGDICQIWQQDNEGLHQLEGGHIRGVEWLLLANLICLDPASIIVRNRVFADSELLSMLETVFGAKVIYEDDQPTAVKEHLLLDKQ
ncbi:MAG: hypothetical protein GX572_05550 [Clostridia bacterium]|nr:hypothetical protein [Clostridia bacterium]